MGTEKYGRHYWGVKVTKDISPDGEIFVMADDVYATPNGSLEFTRSTEGANRVNLIIAPGKWTSCYTASLFDGHAVAVEYWEGVVGRFNDDFESDSDNGNQKERGKMSKSLRYDVLKRDGFKCVTCGATAADSQLEIDHVLPVSKGGKTEFSNLQTLCLDCNRGKRDKIEG